MLFATDETANIPQILRKGGENLQSKHMKSGSLKCKIIAPLLAAALIGTCVVPAVTSVNTATAASAEDEVGAGNVYSAPVNSSNSANEGLYWANATYFDYLSDEEMGSSGWLNPIKAGTNNFYDSSNVIVELVGKLNANAVVGRTNGDDATAYANTVANYNKDSLTYTNKYDPTDNKEGNTVHVYTFSVDIYKVDSTNEATKLNGATFTLTKGSDVFTETTANGGKATFTGLKAGEYTLKETVAPNGYNLNNTEYTVTINADGTVTSAQYYATLNGVKIGDTPVVMPATGGQGTMIFTIVGISLIACAGLLFIVLKKRSSK